MTTYKVSYIENGQILAIPYQCPKQARQFFEQKKAQNIPCALIAIDDDNIKPKAKVKMADVRELKAQGLSLDEIALKLGATKERILQVWGRIKRHDKAIADGYQLDKNNRFIRRVEKTTTPPSASNQPPSA